MNDELLTEARIADYVNGQLDVEQRKAFEAAMATDTKLQQRVAFESKLKSAVVNEPLQSAANPQFEQIAGQLEEQQGGVWQRFFGWPQQAVYAFSIALLAAVLVFFQADNAIENTDNEYITLSDSKPEAASPILRLLAWDADAMQQLLEDFQPYVSASYADALTIDLQADEQQLDQLVLQLSDDHRINLLQRIETKQ